MKQKIIIGFICICATVFSQTTLINGVFSVNRTNYFDNAQLKSDYNVAAYFASVAVSVIPPTSFVNAGNVNFNDTAIAYNSSNKFYSKTQINSLPQMKWTISGAGSIPAMNFVYNGTIPSFTFSPNTIKDTLKKTDTLFITLNGIQNADSVIVSFTDDVQQATQHRCAFIAPNYTNIYYIVPSVFSGLTVGPRAYIKIDVVNYNYQTISNKQYLFRNVFSFTRGNIKIVN